MATYTAQYKGHTIVVKKSIPSKRLFVDGELQDVSAAFFEAGTLLWGRIKSGDGCGDTVKVRLAYCNPWSFLMTCWIFVNDTLISKQ